MVWYQKFEYSLGHWMQKATEHVFGSVLCSPGCFSLFRANAVMDNNVMHTYTRDPENAAQIVQYDQGNIMLNLIVSGSKGAEPGTSVPLWVHF